uniref:Endonuclease/exonuclease/phosphatase domain-containing protein n=1 Tax=viral metagenome TaxID=1070528 RepID=A0A6C0HW93_9ZZZZ
MKIFLYFLLLSSFISLFAIDITENSGCAIVPTISTDRRPNKDSFRIVQYNVEWLFVDYYSNADCPGAHCPWHNQTEAITHLNSVSTIIKTLNPDIINFCEVEGCDELNMLATNLNDSTYKPYLKKGTDSATGQNVGMLTRIDPIVDLYRTEERISYPISGSNCGYIGPTGDTSGVSKHYITEFVLNNVHIAFIGTHLLAYPTDTQRCAEREAQAQVLQKVIANYLDKGYEIIVMGDFNDFDAEVIDANNNKPISQVLDIVKGNFGTYAGKYQLHNIADTIVQPYRFSDWWDQNDNCVSTPNEFSMIDHILVTPFLHENIVMSFIYQEYDEFCDTYNSDHYPVVIDIVLG